MSIRLGDVYVEIPAGSSTSITFHFGPGIIKAEKPDTPEPLEEPQYIYRPNDPFRSIIDEARAVASISVHHKPWVRKTWFILFVIGPLLYAGLSVTAHVLQNGAFRPSGSSPGYDTSFLFLWFLYFSIWIRKARAESRAS